MVSGAKPWLDSTICIVTFNASATAWMISASAHVPYLSHEVSVLLSINLSGLSLINWTLAVHIRIWSLLLPYNWCDTDLKKQSPAPPTSIDCKPSSPYLDCIKFSEEIGEVNCIVELWFCIKGLIITSWWSVLYWVGPGYFSTSLLSLKFK